MNNQIIDFSKFEKCIFRSKRQLIKKSCCSGSKIFGFKCEKKNISPLSPIQHCSNCKEFIEDK
jgi:hypothetical protein